MYRTNNCKYYGLSWDSTATEAPTWDPDPDSVAVGNWGACIENGIAPLTGEDQNGRLTSQDGGEITIGYRVGQVETHWETILQNLATCPSGDDVTLEQGTLPAPKLEFNLIENLNSPDLIFEFATLKNELIEIEIYNLHGQKDAQLIHTGSSLQKNSIHLNTTKFSEGVYFISVSNAQNSTTRKFHLVK